MNWVIGQFVFCLKSDEKSGLISPFICMENVQLFVNVSVNYVSFASVLVVANIAGKSC